MRPLAAFVAALLSLLAPSIQSGHAQQPSSAPAVSTEPSKTEAENKEAPKLADDIFETVTKVPVTVKLPSNKSYTGQMILTYYKPAGNGPFPLVIMNHGRVSKDKRALTPRFRYTMVARFWVRRGFAVIVPTRLGYGETGLDPDPEFAGLCANPDYQRVLAVMLEQTAVALKFGKTLAWVDASRVIVMGQSYGGFASIGASAYGLPGLLAAINFAGGAGGDPDKRSAQPCGGPQLGALFLEAGKRAQVPMLWLYSENDKFWGVDWPRRWHAAYAKGGGRAELKTFPPVEQDGHKLLENGFRLWRPALDRFIEGLGFPPPKSKDAPEATGFARLDEVDKLPFVRDEVKSDAYQRFLDVDLPRAFAIAPNGSWAWRGGYSGNAIEAVLERCRETAKRACRLYAVDDAVVWTP